LNTPTVNWPEKYHPNATPVHVQNELHVAAPAETVWAWLIRAPAWPDWYPNAHNVRIHSEPFDRLGLDTQFTWRTFGVSIRSTIREFVPYERLAWDASGTGVDAYHAWLISAAEGGCHVLTEETQYGWAARLGGLLFPNRMSRFHQIWLERLALMARTGSPSS
jgi:uncharacterized protein YndB with AHSA1/START domain